MGISTAPSSMTSEEIVALSREHTFFSWSVQGAVDPIAIDRAEGVYLYTPEGRRILDFNSQLMSVNIGHGDRRVIDAITAQAEKLQYVQPAFVTESRARLGAKLAEILPGDLDKVFFTLGGAEAIENALKLARHFTGRYKVLARYRAYHGATMGAVGMSGKGAEKFETQMFYGGLTYSSHAISCAAAIATIGVYEEDGLIQNAARLDGVMRTHHERLHAKHPSVGAYRNLGLFGILDLVRSRDPFTPMTPFNGTSDEMKAVAKHLRDNGLYTMIANNSIHTNPPLCITQAQ